MHFKDFIFMLLASGATHTLADSVTVKLDLVEAPDWTQSIEDGYCWNQNKSRTGRARGYEVRKSGWSCYSWPTRLCNGDPNWQEMRGTGKFNPTVKAMSVGCWKD